MEPPPKNCLKLNVDTSWNNAEDRGGIGWVIHDSIDSLIFTIGKRIRRTKSIKALESMAKEFEKS